MSKTSKSVNFKVFNIQKFVSVKDPYHYHMVTENVSGAQSKQMLFTENDSFFSLGEVVPNTLSLKITKFFFLGEVVPKIL
jgi:hypothetical protein